MASVRVDKLFFVKTKNYTKVTPAILTIFSSEWPFINLKQKYISVVKLLDLLYIKRNITTLLHVAKSSGAVEYTDYFSAEG